MQERTLARRYAKGLFEEALDRKVLEQVERELHLVAPVLCEPGVARALNNPCVSSAQKRQIVQAALGSSCSTAIINLLVLMAQRRRMKAFSYVERLFGEMMDEFRRLARVQVRIAAPTTEAALGALKSKLTAVLGKTVELEPEVDDSLIGGAMLVLKDTILDGSVKGAIERMRERMRQ